MPFQSSRFDSDKVKNFTENAPNIIGEKVSVTRVLGLDTDPVTGSVKITFWGEMESRPGQVIKMTAKGAIARKAEPMVKVGGDVYVTARWADRMYAYLLDLSAEPPAAAKK